MPTKSITPTIAGSRELWRFGTSTVRCPGQEKMFSTSTVPVMTLPKASPMTVRIGGDAARSTWPEHNRPFGQALGAGGAHVVVLEHLEHGRTGEACEQPHDRNGQHAGGQDQVLDGVREDMNCAGQQGVERVQAGQVRRRHDARVQPAAARHPPPARKRRRTAPPAPARTTASTSRPATPPAEPGRSAGCDARRPGSQADPEQAREHHRRNRQLSRRAECTQPGRRRTGRGSARRSPMSPCSRFVTVHHILHWQWLIEAVALVVQAHSLGVGGRLVAQVGNRRIAWDDVCQDERHHGHPDAEQNHCHQAPYDEEDQWVPRAALCERRSQ